MPRIALVFVVSRLLLLAVAVAVELTQPGLVPPEHLVTDDRDIWQTLTAWDGVWYRSIAETGYHAEFDRWPDYVFYPIYPVAMRVMSLVVGDWSLAALLVSNGAFALALVVLYALSRRYLERERTIFSLWLLALAPGSFAFGLAYTESLFLLLAVGAFLAAEQRRYWLVGLLLVLSTLARPIGILLLLPLVALLCGGPATPARWLHPARSAATTRGTPATAAA